MRSSHQPILGSNNHPLDIYGVTEIKLRIKDVEVQHQAYVCNDLAQELLLGADFLKENNCVVNFEKETVTIRDKECKMGCANYRKICRVTVASSTTIPPRCVVNVKCKVEQVSVIGATTGVLEPEPRFEERYSLGVIKVMATVKEGGIPAQLFNPHHKAVKIYRGSTVGNPCPVLEPGEDENLAEPQTCYHICPSSCESKSKEGTSSKTTSQGDNQKRKQAMAEMFKIDNPNLPTEENIKSTQRSNFNRKD